METWLDLTVYSIAYTLYTIQYTVHMVYSIQYIAVDFACNAYSEEIHSNCCIPDRCGPHRHGSSKEAYVSPVSVPATPISGGYMLQSYSDYPHHDMYADHFLGNAPHLGYYNAAYTPEERLRLHPAFSHIDHYKKAR